MNNEKVHVIDPYSVGVIKTRDMMKEVFGFRIDEDQYVGVAEGRNPITREPNGRIYAFLNNEVSLENAQGAITQGKYNAERFVKDNEIATGVGISKEGTYRRGGKIVYDNTRVGIWGELKEGMFTATEMHQLLDIVRQAREARREKETKRS